MNLFPRAGFCAALALLAACDAGGPAKPQPGDLTVSLTTPRTDDRAMVVTVAGPDAVTDVQPASAAYVVHARTEGTTTRIAVFGLLASGPALRITVPDVRQARRYAATVVEVVDGQNAPRASLAGYAAAVAR